MNPLSQFSYVWISGMVVLALAAYFWYTGFNRAKALALSFITLSLFVAWWSLRPTASTVQAATEARLIIREAQQPVLVQFYSEYCAACIAVEPTLNQLEQDLADELKVVRIDVASAAGQEFSRQLNLQYTPTFVLFDVQGQEIWRQAGGLDDDEVRRLINEG
ncbi:MAG: thioredoxin family protein [Anaerolineales bacterium]|nr:thioredoxin family protein [Anaerolineales bacterium]